MNYTRQTIDYQKLPDTFSLLVPDSDAVNVNFIKELYRKVIPTHEIQQRAICPPNTNQLYPSTIFVFVKKSARKIRRESGKSTDT